MVQARNIGTGTIPLELTKIITNLANKEWEEKTFFDKVSPITKDLLNFWDPEGNFGQLRKINFHKGQWQAILNAIYVHEVLKIKGIKDMYFSIYPELLSSNGNKGKLDILELQKEKHEHPKYCIKMATGTGKTWVMHALLIWQYLNAKYNEAEPSRFSKNFLLVAPGLIVYERLLDAFLGKMQENGKRNSDESDFKKFEELFLSSSYKEEILGFIQSNVVEKEDIGKKVAGEGIIAITNWHILTGEEEERELGESPIDNPSIAVNQLLPITPGTSAGQSLDVLDSRFFRGKQIDFLSNLKDLVVFNDEAHHLGEWKKADEVLEKKWQQALIDIAKNKKERFVQVDFSATPYNVTGSGQNRRRHFFPHIITNFELREAIHQGLVKIVAIDKRKEFGAPPLEFKAEREGRKVKDLSEGQRLMLRAGLSKLRFLQKEFTDLDKTKNPKMLIICEDTFVVDYVIKFLKSEGLGEEEIMEIHSTKKGDVPPKEWDEIKQRLFNIDKYENPKVIVSVLMLREGFDVNNICVIVPLRSSSSYILLEQVIGRGLRLMWRGDPVYEEMRINNLDRLLKKKQEPDNYIDILSIIEHQEYEKFYDRELSSDDIAEIKAPLKREKILGDIIKVGLKKDYKNYDFFWPIIIRDKEEELIPTELDLEELEKYPVPLKELKTLISKEGEIFKSEEVTVKTKFGEYTVTSDIFTANSYQSFISKLVTAVSSVYIKTGKRSSSVKRFPLMQINIVQIARLVDNYIRTKLFGEKFDPLENNNWKILLITEAKILQHIIKNISKKVYNLQKNINVEEAKIIKKYFSEISELKIRESYALSVAKTIYEKIPFPSNKGGFERAFIESIDSDSKVERFMKVNEYYHAFANILYIREDGQLAHYFPDFIVKIGKNIYLVETKAESNLSNQNVLQKRLATIDWTEKVNQLKLKDRMDCTWHYVLLGEKTFYGMEEKGASTQEILDYTKMTKAKIKGTLGDFLGLKEY